LELDNLNDIVNLKIRAYKERSNNGGNFDIENLYETEIFPKIKLYNNDKQYRIIFTHHFIENKNMKIINKILKNLKEKGLTCKVCHVKNPIIYLGIDISWSEDMFPRDKLRIDCCTIS
jgi:glycosyltransferase involved in cell wall biosynthesis